jgi:hypothetical protein
MIRCKTIANSVGKAFRHDWMWQCANIGDKHVIEASWGKMKTPAIPSKFAIFSKLAIGQC